MEKEIRNSLLKVFPESASLVEKYILQPLCLSHETLTKVRDLLNTNISQSFNTETRALTPLQLFPSYVTNRIDTIDDGTYLALDLGGTNLRVMFVKIEGTKTTSEMTSTVIPTEVLKGSGTQLFDFIADAVFSFLQANDLLATPSPLPLGFTFSFPVNQMGLNKAILQSWTKEFVCADVVGQDVGKMMQDAFERKGDMNVKCVAIINDTVGTLIAGAFIDRTCTLGLICGTGTNGCCFETQDNLGIQLPGVDKSTRVAVDTMWNNFGNDGSVDFLRSEYDFEIARQATHPNQAQCEKMMCAMFAGEVVRHVILKLHAERLCFQTLSEQLRTKESFTTQMISEIVEDDVTGFPITRGVLADLGMADPGDQDCRAVYHVCQLVTIRAASLVAACCACLVNRMGLPENGIAVDGSFYRGNTLFARLLNDTMAGLVNPGLKYHFVPCQDGSGLGAALVAAMKTPT